jgi:hypothetical protein
MEPNAESIPLDILPVCCPGCGAYAHTSDPNEPGYYSRSRKKARKLWDKTKKAIERRNGAPGNTNNPGHLGESSEIDIRGKNSETVENQVISLPSRKYNANSSVLGISGP